MIKFSRNIIFIFTLLIQPSLSYARCSQPPIYQGRIKILECREIKAGEIFIYGEIVSVQGEGKTHFPSIGARFRFFKGLSPIVKNTKGSYEITEISFCKENKVGSIIDDTFSKPCCDALYPWCDGKVEYIIN